MFCPLCKAEFRQGFTTCSDCHIPLVTTSEEAAAVEADRLWTGDNRKLMIGILDRLTDAGIAFHAKELPKSSAWPWFSMPLWLFSVLLGWLTKPLPTFEFHIDVFRMDIARAKDIVRAVEEAENLGFDDVEK